MFDLKVYCHVFFVFVFLLCGLSFHYLVIFVFISDILVVMIILFTLTIVNPFLICIC